MREKIATAVIFVLLALPCGAIVSMVDGTADYRASRAWQSRSVPEKALNLLLLDSLARYQAYNYATTYGSSEPFIPNPQGKNGWKRVLDGGFTAMGLGFLYLLALLIARRIAPED